MRFRQFRNEARRIRRRRFVASLLAAGLLVTFAANSANALTSPPGVGECAGVTHTTTESLVACLLELGNPVDFAPRDMKVAAPSSVIASAMTTTPNTSAPSAPDHRRIADVNRFRPNPQAWIDAKNRLAQGTGLTTRDLAETGRWKPKLTPGSGTSFLRAGSSVLAFSAVAGMVSPALEDGLGLEGSIDSYWCSQRAAGRFELVGYLTTPDCSGWQAAQDAAVALEPSAQSLVGRQVCDSQGNCEDILLVTSAWALGGQTVNNRRTGEICVTRNTAFNSVIQLQLHGSAGTEWGVVAQSGLWPPHGCRFGVDRLVHSRSSAGNDYVSVVGVRVLEGAQVVSTISADPGHAEWVTRVKCLDGSIRWGFSEPFEFAPGGMMPEPASVDMTGCDPVEMEVGVQTAGKGEQGWTTATKVGHEMVPTEVQDWMRDFPQCLDGSCVLELKKDLGSGLLDCFEAPEQCIDWYEESVAHPERYKCYYGGVLRGLSECFVYARVFDRQAVQQGQGYADPSTGQAPAPGTSGTTNPGAAAVPAPIASPSQSRQCWPEGWAAFNPFEWVLQPVKCALEWAFVPKQVKIQRVTTNIRLTALNSRPGQIISSLEAWGEMVPSASGCMGPEFRIDILGFHYSGYPLQACTGATAHAASMTRIALSIAFVIMGLAAITRFLGKVFDFTGLGGGAE